MKRRRVIANDTSCSLSFPFTIGGNIQSHQAAAGIFFSSEKINSIERQFVTPHPQKSLHRTFTLTFVSFDVSVAILLVLITSNSAVTPHE